MNKVFKALSDPTRRRVLQLLRHGPRSAGDLAAEFAVSKPTMSAHFSVLLEAGLIDADKQGRNVLYQLRLSVLEDALLGFAETVSVTAGRARKPARSRAALTPSRRPA